MEGSIDLEELLDGKPSWEQVVEFWKATIDGSKEFHDEANYVRAIKKHLRTEKQREKLYELDLSIEEVLNGGYSARQDRAVSTILRAWNRKLGFKAFNA